MEISDMFSNHTVQPDSSSTDDVISTQGVRRVSGECDPNLVFTPSNPITLAQMMR